jgi:hypothetical protein
LQKSPRALPTSILISSPVKLSGFELPVPPAQALSNQIKATQRLGVNRKPLSLIDVRFVFTNDADTNRALAKVDFRYVSAVLFTLFFANYAENLTKLNQITTRQIEL